MPSSRNETASFSSSANFTLTAPSSSSSSTYRSPSTPPSPNSSVTRNHHRNSNNDAVTSTSSSSPSSPSSPKRRSCMCSPTTHPGSFRCAYHKRLIMEQQQNQTASVRHSSNGTSNRSSLGRSAMRNALVKIESEILRNPLTIFINSPSHQSRRRETFQPRLSRLSIMSKAQDS